MPPKRFHRTLGLQERRGRRDHLSTAVGRWTQVSPKMACVASSTVLRQRLAQRRQPTAGEYRTFARDSKRQCVSACVCLQRYVCLGMYVSQEGIEDQRIARQPPKKTRAIER